MPCWFGHHARVFQIQNVSILTFTRKTRENGNHCDLTEFFCFAVDEYIQIAKEKYGYNAEQALGMLFWHKHDLDRAVQDLANFTPFPDEWSIEDKVLFEQAFQFHGKSFHRIRQMLPDKSIAQLVKYYYR